MKKIALVHDFLFKLGGAERVLARFKYLFPHAPIFTLFYDASLIRNTFPTSQITTSFLQRLPRYFHHHPQYLLPLFPFGIESFDFSSFDLVISSSGAFSHGIITSPQTRHICYCHSPMRYAWDYTHEYLGEKNLSFLKRMLVRKILMNLRLWDRVSADRPDLFVANSKHVQKRIQKYYQKSATVIYPPVDIDRFSVSSSAEPYFVILSALSPFKRVDLAIMACNALKKKLIIIGDGEEKAKLNTLAGPGIQFLGRVSDEKVKNILEGAQALLFPGEEDFGIAPVEAMACGKPVIAYGKGGVLESVQEDVSGIFFFEPHLDSCIEAIHRFEKQKHHFNPLVIRKTVERFHPRHFDEQMLSLINCNIDS